MPTELQTQVTLALTEAHAGITEARLRLVELVAREIRQAATLAGAAPGTVTEADPAALVRAAFERLVATESLADERLRGCFYSAAAHALRQVVVERARLQLAPDATTLPAAPLDALVARFSPASVDLAKLEEALCQLEALHARQGQVFTLRYFGGLSIGQVADQLEISEAVVDADYRKASAFVLRQVQPGGSF